MSDVRDLREELRDRRIGGMRIAECGKRQTLGQMQIARPHHHAAFAVYMAASPHAVLRNGKVQPSKCQRLHDIPLGDQCRVKGVCLTRLGENYRKGLNRSRIFND
jgi:hypothetical protein